MTGTVLTLRQLAAGFALGIILQTPAFAQSAEAELAETVTTLEAGLGGRIGVLVRDAGSDWSWGHREDERFMMASTFKSVLCGAVLAQLDVGALSLDEPLKVDPEDILEYAPVAERHVGGTLSVGELCLATLDMSDNTAANLLIERLGGPQAVTDFARAAGDEVTRLDRMEPELNTFTPGDLRDTTSPAAMLSTWEAMLLGDVLTPASREQLIEWMSRGGVTQNLIRASTPEGWLVADKSGSGEGSRNLVAMISPPGRAPFLVAIYISETPADVETRNAAVADIGAAMIKVISTR